MATLSAPIRSSGGRKARRNILRAARIFLLWPVVSLVAALYYFDAIFAQVPVLAYVAVAVVAALLVYNLFLVGMILWVHCRWLEFDGVYLRGRRMWPFGEFECPVERIREIAPGLHKFREEPEAHGIRFGKWQFVNLYRDMTNSEELLSALQAAVANRGTHRNDDATTSTTA